MAGDNLGARLDGDQAEDLLELNHAFVRLSGQLRIGVVGLQSSTTPIRTSRGASPGSRRSCFGLEISHNDRTIEPLESLDAPPGSLHEWMAAARIGRAICGVWMLVTLRICFRGSERTP